MEENETVKTIKETILEKVKVRIPYNEDVFKTQEAYDILMETLVEDSSSIFLSLKFPFEDYGIEDIPAKYINWVVRASYEIYKQAGRKNVQQYSENGLSWMLFKDGLSKDLIGEIISTVGIPRSVE